MHKDRGDCGRGGRGPLRLLESLWSLPLRLTAMLQCCAASKLHRSTELKPCMMKEILICKGSGVAMEQRKAARMKNGLELGARRRCRRLPKIAEDGQCLRACR
eukprot:s105_g18.t1